MVEENQVSGEYGKNIVRSVKIGWERNRFWENRFGQNAWEKKCEEEEITTGR